MKAVPLEIWDGAYDQAWGELLHPDAYCHPAKMSRGLVVRIFNELLAMGALAKGDIVVDPFGGIGSTGIAGASVGVQVVCVELEQKFVDLAKKNFEGHRRDWSAMGRPQPMILQGDSRRLRQVLAGVGDGEIEAAVSSPPYVSGGHHADQTGAWNTNNLGMNKGGTSLGSRDVAGYGRTDGQLGQMAEGEIDAAITSPPHGGNAKHDYGSEDGVRPREVDRGYEQGRGCFRGSESAYGRTEGQLARLPKGDVDAAVSSPPFLDARSHVSTHGSVKGATAPTEHDPEAMGRSDGNLNALKPGTVDGVVSSPPYPQPHTAGGGINVTGYGKDGADKVGERTYQGRGAERDAGNLETLPSGDVDGTVSSPPYEGSLAASQDGIDWEKAARTNNTGGEHRAKGVSANPAYPVSSENVGNMTGETFWSASLKIVREVHAILKPGGYAVWVVKMFVRDKVLQDFPGDWRRLCEHVGFETVKEVRASLVTRWEENTLFNGVVQKERKRASFFRRLAESKGSPKIEWETVWFTRKPSDVVSTAAGR